MDYLQVRELYHWGIKGQKWGIRRYQNEDGSLTEEGRRRYNVGYYEAKDKGETPQLYAYPEGKGPKGVYYRDANGNEVRYKGNIHDLSDAEVVDMTKRASSEENIQRKLNEGKVSSEQAVKATSQLLNDVAKQMPTGNGKIIKKNYSNITDSELRERINRLKLEDEYGRLTGDTKYVKSGSEKAKEMLQTAGAVVALGGSALVLAKGIISLFPDKDTKNSPAAKKTRKKAATKTASTLLLPAPVKHNMQKLQNGNELYHYGIKGQKWGIRRYQNKDGTLTPEGKKRLQDATDAIGRFQENAYLGYVLPLIEGKQLSKEHIRKSNKLRKQSQKFIKALEKEKINIYTKDLVEKGKSYCMVLFGDPETGKYLEGTVPGTKKEPFSHYRYEYKTVLPLKHSNDLANSELYHYGIKGQKWGERRFQNPDGTLTAEGKARYYDDLASKEMLNNSSRYDRMGRNHRREYVDYGRKQGAKKGFLTGMLAGATVGGGKTVLDFIKNKNSADNKDMPVDRKINRFMRNTILGAFGGSVVGTLTGATVGKHKAQADLAKYGKEYAEAVLSLPIDNINIKHSDLTDIELYHFGIKGQKWGIRRYQNEDGSLTEEGRIRYGKFDKLSKATTELEKSYEPIKSTYEKWVSNEGPGDTLVDDYTQPSGKFYDKKYTLNDGSPNMKLINKDYNDYVYKEYHKLFENKNFKDAINNFKKVKQNYESIEMDAWGDLKNFKNYGYKDPIVKAYIDDNSKRTYSIYEASRIFDPKNLELSPSDLVKVVTYGLFD